MDKPEAYPTGTGLEDELRVHCLDEVFLFSLGEDFEFWCWLVSCVNMRAPSRVNVRVMSGTNS
jgi:hypothetical protein